MRRKVWLARDLDGWYGLFLGRPRSIGGSFYEGVYGDVIIRRLCESITRKWLIDRHIRKGTCVEGYFNTSLKPLKKKGRR